MGLETTLVAHLTRRSYEDLPADAVHAAKRSLLDMLAVALATTTQSADARAILNVARSFEGAENCTVLGFGYRLPSYAAAFVNGALCHPLDFDDTHEEARIHPTAGAFAAAMAASEIADNVSGQTFLAALSLTSDFQCRIGLAVDATPPEHGWLTSTVIGHLGGAAAASRLLGLTEEMAANALGLVYCQTGGSQEMGVGTGTYRAIRDGFTQKAGLLSALLAREGVGGPHSFLEGRRGLFNQYFGSRASPGVALADLGVAYEGSNVSYKMWPCCRLSQTYVTSLRDLIRQHRLTPDQVVRIDVVGNNWTRLLFEPYGERIRPATAMKAKYSIPFTLALMLVHNTIRIEHFSDAALQDPQVLDVAKRVNCSVDPAIDDGDFAAGDVTVLTVDGRKLHNVAPYALGHPNNAVSDADLSRKFRECARYAVHQLTEETLARIEDYVWHLEELPDITALWALLGQDHNTVSLTTPAI